MLDRKIEPMLCMPTEVFDNPDWIFEPKYDGARALFIFNRDTNNLRIQNRKFYNITHRYPEFANLPECMADNNCVLDGELVYLDGGLPNFNKLAKREHLENPLKIKLMSKQLPLTFMVFDILYLDGEDLTDYPLIRRKQLLDRIIENSDRIKKVEFIDGQGKQLFEQMLKEGREGIVAKKKDSRYCEGDRNGLWKKIKRSDTIDLPILGYKKGEGHRERLGSLITPLCDVGSGLADEDINFFFEHKPTIVEVKYMEKTPDGRLRHPVFIRFRMDKEVCDDK